ncbi:HTH cro/C1-type domain-containing protein [Bordetella sputigena]
MARQINARASLAKEMTRTEDENAKRLGDRLRTLRGDRGFSTLELAARSGVSAGMISQIERGNSNPSIKTLQRLRSALGISVWQFFDEPKADAPATPPFVLRRGQRPMMELKESGLVKELLSPQSADDLRFMFIEMSPGSATEDVFVGGGQKAGYVIAGSVQLTVGDVTATLDVGDSFQFNSNVEHALANPSDVEARVLWIISGLDTHL